MRKNDEHAIISEREQVVAVNEISVMISSFIGRLNELSTMLDSNVDEKLSSCSLSLDKIEERRSELLKVFVAIDKMAGFVEGVSEKVDSIEKSVFEMERCYQLRHPDQLKKVISSFNFLGGGSRNKGPPPDMPPYPEAPKLGAKAFFDELRQDSSS